MVAVLMLFLIPFGGGIPAGVLLARTNELPWPLTAALYLVSDVILAFAFEPVLRLVVKLGRNRPRLAHATATMKESMDRTAALYGSKGAGPFTLIMVAFGVDPMTGRAAALAAGHGFVAGWAIAISGDMIYYAVVAFTTLQLTEYVENPRIAVFLMMSTMLLVPLLVRGLRARWSKRRK